MKRREFLKGMGLVAAGAAIAPETLAKNSSIGKGISFTDDFNPDTDKRGDLNELDIKIKGMAPNVNRRISAVVVGAGSRGNTYGKYALRYPEALKIVGVSDINPMRKERFAREYDIPKERQYGDFHEILAAGKIADAMIISTPDDLHYEPCMKALELGYDVLLEKPCAQTEKECRAILAQAKKYNRLVAVCHVLRYAPYFIALKNLLDNGYIGTPVSFQHMEPIQYAHMAHSYVRGNWRDSKQTTPIILAKSCHDLDILRWLVGKPCKSISAYGSLALFKQENAPQGAPLRCTDGCPHEAECPYSAIDVYCNRREHLGVFDLPKGYDNNTIMEKLRSTGYGRCVYHCDNDQPDHYVANMEFEGGVTAAFSMEAFTPFGGRRTKIMGTKGMISGDGKQFTITEFRSRKRHVWNKNVAEIPEYRGAGHGGGDLVLMRDFVEAVAWQDKTRLTSTIEASIESHVMGFAAEKSRKSDRKVKVSI